MAAFLIVSDVNETPLAKAPICRNWPFRAAGRRHGQPTGHGSPACLWQRSWIRKPGDWNKSRGS
jgi:hypothetical protein